MKVQPKRWKRRQVSLERAYWFVRELMIEAGIQVREVCIPRWVPEDCYVATTHLRCDCKGFCIQKNNLIVVRSSEDCEETLYHECVHANQPVRDESHIPYWNRPKEIEARKFARIALLARRKKAS